LFPQHIPEYKPAFMSNIHVWVYVQILRGKGDKQIYTTVFEMKIFIIFIIILGFILCDVFLNDGVILTAPTNTEKHGPIIV